MWVVWHLCFKALVPNLFGTRTSFMEDNFSTGLGLGEDGFGMIQALHSSSPSAVQPMPNRSGSVPASGPEVGDPFFKGI